MLRNMNSLAIIQKFIDPIGESCVKKERFSLINALKTLLQYMKTITSNKIAKSLGNHIKPCKWALLIVLLTASIILVLNADNPAVLQWALSVLKAFTIAGRLKLSG
jgi:hypothetical protein